MATPVFIARTFNKLYQVRAIDDAQKYQKDYTGNGGQDAANESQPANNQTCKIERHIILLLGRRISSTLSNIDSI